MSNYPGYLWNEITKDMRPWVAYTAGSVIWLLSMIIVVVMFFGIGPLIAMSMFWEFLTHRFEILDRISAKVSNLKYLFVRRSE